MSDTVKGLPRSIRRRFPVSPDRLPSLAGLPVLVVGLGRFGGGVGVARWLAGQGARVTVTDRANPESLADSIDALDDLDVTFRLGGENPGAVETTALAIINPAVIKARSDIFQAIVRRNIPWTTEINLFCERCPARVIGVTGAYGKSTTATMLAHVLETHTGRDRDYTDVYLGGNIGGSLLAVLNTIRPTDWVVLEISSAQLEDLPRIGFAPRIAVVTNLSPHHIERYGTYSDYVAVKLGIVGDRGITEVAIVGPLDKTAEHLLHRLLPDDPPRVLRVTPPDPPIRLPLPGDHQQENAACVLAVCQELGVSDEIVRSALGRFTGLAHRLEHIRTLDGVDYYNDSKSTSPHTTVIAIQSLGQPIVAIVGGQDRGVPKDACAEVLSRSCRLVICVGASGHGFAQAVRAAPTPQTRAVICEVKGLEAAVKLAREQAHPKDAVLFSPGAPSYDAYVNFVERGRHFIALVNALS